MDLVEITADGGNGLAAPRPRAPTPRPDIGPVPSQGVLADAPQAGQADLPSKGFANRDNHEPAAMVPKESAAQVGVVSGSGANMRAGAHSNSPIVVALAAGSIVTVVKCASWCEIIA